VTTPTPTASPSGSGGFGDMLGRALETVSDSHARADDLAVQAATGDLTAVHDYTIAATEAQLLTQLTVEVRNRAVEAFNDIMRMQV
jgi:flagellar hook-basal body complex protein FliE